MMELFHPLSFLSYILTSLCSATNTYVSDWSSLNKRPLPAWYDQAKIGILVHWGVYSVPSYQTEMFWKLWGSDKGINKFMKKNYPLGFHYRDFGPLFRAEFFSPKSWAKLFAQAGAKYVVITSKHHDGYTLFPSKQSSGWNSLDVGPRRDLVGNLSEAVKAKGLKFGVYYSLLEWHHPTYLKDKAKGYKVKDYPIFKALPDLTQIVEDYKPSLIWSDGDWEANDTYWGSKDFLAWLYNDSPIKDEVVVNDRWGGGVYCHNGDFYTCSDRNKPEIRQDHKWENAFSLDKISWGYRRNMDVSDVMTFPDLLKEVVSTVSGGGNVLINVGATKEGMIPPIFQERLITLGEWLKPNAEAIYETSPWLHQQDSIQNDSKIWYTCVKNSYNGLAPNAMPDEKTVLAIYAIILEKILKTKTVKLRDIAGLLGSGNYGIHLLGDSTYYLKWTIISNVVIVHMPATYPAYPILKIIRTKNSNSDNNVVPGSSVNLVLPSQ